ncbi:MAG: methyltransferase, TrmH family, group 3 [Hyphomicrobiales bacterium]|nr:methyltransferase, TrmH family, group 3 [Hyphomicrobiales bacterium]
MRSNATHRKAATVTRKRQTHTDAPRDTRSGERPASGAQGARGEPRRVPSRDAPDGFVPMETSWREDRTPKPRSIQPWADVKAPSRPQDKKPDDKRPDAKRYEGKRPEGDRNRRFPPRREGAREALPPTPPDIALIWGYHSVREALRAQRRKFVRLWATAAAAEKLAAELADAKLEAQVVSVEEIDRRLPGDAVHQGLLLEARPLPVVDVEDLPENGLVLVLDQVTDPHNVGAILRTAAAFGVDAIVTTERHSPALTGVLAKTASGGLEHVAIASVVNLARALEALGRMGYLRVGLDSDGERTLNDAPLTRPLALVLGAEGKGLRRLSRENCDILARIDLPGAVRSLNVSNACAVALTIAQMKLPKAAS